MHLKKKDNYYIYLVTSVFSEKEVSIEKIKNPIELIEGNIISCEPNTYSIDLRK